MRYRILVLGIGACLALSSGWVAQVYDHATTAALTDDARLAIDVRCKLQSGRSARECRDVLKKLYLAGSLDPDKTLRTYCDLVRTAPGGNRRAVPPKVCVERYGGWQQS